MPLTDKEPKEPRTEKFRLTLVDDDTHRSLGVFKFTRGNLLIAIISVVTLFLLGSFALIALTPIKTWLPGYPDEKTRQEAIKNSLAIDSLGQVVSRWEFYSENLKRVLEGADPVKIDSVIKSYASTGSDSASADALRRSDSLMRQAVTDAEQQAAAPPDTRKDLPIEGKQFFKPIKGVISEAFNPSGHPYVDITAPEGSTVSAVLDGTVINSAWSDMYGYSVAIQHDDNIISIYRYNQKVLHSTGERVTAGTPVAMIGTSESQTKGNHLQFQLWYKGEAVNPEDYINF